jgi:GxxExxY protein
MFLEKELSERLMKCFYAARNKYGNGHNERVYDRVLDEQFDLENINYVSQPRIDIYSLDTGKKIAIYIPDKLVENKIIVEIKAKPFTTKDNEQQLIAYLKTSKYEIGYLVNFGEKNFNPKRFIYTNDRKPFGDIRSTQTRIDKHKFKICENL